VDPHRPSHNSAPHPSPSDAALATAVAILALEIRIKDSQHRVRRAEMVLASQVNNLLPPSRTGCAGLSLCGYVGRSRVRSARTRTPNEAKMMRSRVRHATGRRRDRPRSCPSVVPAQPGSVTHFRRPKWVGGRGVRARLGPRYPPRGWVAKFRPPDCGGSAAASTPWTQPT
jgi:hypothetical protein